MTPDDEGLPVLPALRRWTITTVAAFTASAAALTGAHFTGQQPQTAKVGAVSYAAPAAKAITAANLYVDPYSNPAAWVAANPGDWRAARIKAAIADRPIARWFGNWDSDITAAVSRYVGAAAQSGATPMLVAYNVPGRDCGSHSGGGAGSPDAYRNWIGQFAAAIGSRQAVVVVEPDAVAQLDCLPNDTERQIRLDLLRYGVQQLKQKAPNAWVYLDAANANWIPAGTMAQRLQAAGIADARGFSVNVSNYYTTEQSVTYARAVNAGLPGGKTFVVDTSRNGNGSNGEWCNPAGRRLGTPPRQGADAELELWVKVPGDSDGDCGIGAGIPAGQFSPDLAIRLIDGTR
ncbi:glycoside hydrolase family 6 protein [Actinomadura sp. 7K534]|uniref:glycoside hydrolase family 6 protein n=1 Tax=Actinomadura sp. 7K534 TaxID=2530366 RepID=UPI00104C745C|nr:glycoside hydrolase family 6 protein [Actinomadura sp. 7K534]TDB94156.1 endoglucanase [Actinomadura sp. 7K534]